MYKNNTSLIFVEYKLFLTSVIHKQDNHYVVNAVLN